MTALRILVAAMMLADVPSLDYTFFKEKVQPIFLKKRPGHARCVSCHDHRSPALQPLAPGATTWSEEDSRKMNPDYYLVLPWHFLSEFLERERDYLEGGGQFIVPLPEVRVIGAQDSAGSAAESAGP